MKISNKKNTDTVEKFLRKNKRSIKNLFYDLTKENADPNGYKQGGIKGKLLVAFLVAFGGSQIMLFGGMHAGIIVALSSTVLGTAYVVCEIKDIIEDVKQRKNISQAYEEVKDIYNPYKSELETDVKPVLASYQITNEKGNTRQVNMIINGKNHKLNEIPNVINMILADGTVIVAQDDGFMRVALKIDELIFNYQYEGYEQDMSVLHSIIKAYVDLKTDEKLETSEQERKLHYELGRMYTIVHQKINRRKAQNFELKLVLKNDEKNSTGK